MDYFCHSLSFIICLYQKILMSLNAQILCGSLLSKIEFSVLLCSPLFLVSSYTIFYLDTRKLLAEGHPLKLYIIICNHNLISLLYYLSFQKLFCIYKGYHEKYYHLLDNQKSAAWPLQQNNLKPNGYHHL